MYNVPGKTANTNYIIPQGLLTIYLMILFANTFVMRISRVRPIWIHDGFCLWRRFRVLSGAYF